VIDWQGTIWAIDIVARETMLFAAAGILIGGIDDIAIDLIYFALVAWRRVARRNFPPPTLADFPVEACSGRIAVFVAAWDESAVIGAMLSAALARFEHPDYRIYVGVYPNDPGTIDAVAAVGRRDARIRMIIGQKPGPTSKADCLNTLWAALEHDGAVQGWRPKAIVLHDAEDIVHPGELALFDRLIERNRMVQLPVLPLVDRRSRLVSGHYCDEFAEAHGKQMVVRQALGAGLPLAGVGCAIAREALETLAAARGGEPFDRASLTEDYELGLGLDGVGGRGIIARVAERRGGRIVAVRAYFPDRIDAAVRQKARWMLGIALAGWDRIGWGGRRDWREYWMRMRDRRAPLAVVVLAAAYLGLVAWALALLGHGLVEAPTPPMARWMRIVLTVNAAMLGWRMAVRAGFTAAAYDWREGCLAPLRMIVGNYIALLAARRAVTRYAATLRGRPARWDKTRHAFPADLAAAIAG
jgi:adsorption protein B